MSQIGSAMLSTIMHRTNEMSKSGNHIKWRVVLGHLFFWVAYTTLNHFINMVQNPGIEMFFIDSIGKYLVAAFIFYITALFILPTFWEQGKYIIAAACILLMSAFSFLLKKFLYFKVFIHFGYPVLTYTNAEFFFLNIWWWSQYTLFAFGYWFASESLKKEKRLRLNEQKQLIAEKERLALENAYLKAQINPHFLFNTLGFFHNRMLSKDPLLAEGLISLTEIMRSSIGRTDKNGLVFLSEEIENIHHLILIYKLRFNQVVFVSFACRVDDTNLKILPHVIMTLVENALKHGDLQDEKYPLQISIYIQNHRLMFITKNKKREGPKDLSHGIGMKYLTAHLERMYGDHYQLNMHDEAAFYTVTLSITTEALSRAATP